MDSKHAKCSCNNIVLNIPSRPIKIYSDYSPVLDHLSV